MTCVQREIKKRGKEKGRPLLTTKVTNKRLPRDAEDLLKGEFVHFTWFFHLAEEEEEKEEKIKNIMNRIEKIGI